MVIICRTFWCVLSVRAGAYIYIVTRLPKQSIDHSIGRTHIWRTRNDLSRIYRGILPHQASAEILTTRTETGCVSPLIISHTREIFRCGRAPVASAEAYYRVGGVAFSCAENAVDMLAHSCPLPIVISTFIQCRCRKSTT